MECKFITHPSQEDQWTNDIQAHAQLATLYYLSGPASLPALTLALRYFARSVELNDSYIRGYYGLKLVSAKLLPLLSESSSVSKRNNDEDDVRPPKVQSVKKLEEIATNKLAEAVRQFSSGNKAWADMDEAEIIAARELLDRDGKIVR